MPKVIPLAALAATLCGCWTPEPKVEFTEGMQLSHYRRVGVAAFRGPGHDGATATAAVQRALGRRGLSIVEPGQMARALDGLKLDAAAPFSMEDLLRIRESTQADALFFGDVAALSKRRRKLSVIVLETQNGEAVARGSLVIAPDDGQGIEGAAERVVSAIEGKLDVLPPHFGEGEAP